MATNEGAHFYSTTQKRGRKKHKARDIKKQRERERERERKKKEPKKNIRKEHYPRAHFSLDTENDFDAERRRIIEYSADDVRGHVRVRRRGRGRHLGRHPGVDFLHAIETKQNKTNVRVRVAFGVVFLYLAIFEGVVRLRETERVNEIGLRGSLYPEKMMSTWKKERPFRRKRRTIVEKKASSSSLSETTTHVLTSRRKTTLRYFSLNDAPDEKDELFREEKNSRVESVDETRGEKPIAVHVEQKFSGGDAFFRRV